MVQDKKWWKEYWKRQRELTKRDLANKDAVWEAKRQEAMTHFEPVPNDDTHTRLVWNGQHEGHND